MRILASEEIYELYNPKPMIQKIVDEVMTAEAQKSRENVTGAGITGWRSSGLGTCMRGRFLNRLLSGTGIKPETDARTLRVFEMGNQVEDWLMKKLVQSPEYDVTQQIEMYDHELNLSGHLDAYLVRKSPTGDEFTDEYIVECKSKHSKAFWYMDKKGEGAQTHHKMQLHSYLYMMNKYGGSVINPVDGSVTSKIDHRGGRLKEGAILYVSKDDMALLEYPVRLNDVELEKMWKFEVETLNKCWNEKTAPPAPEKGSWQEKYCEFCKIGLCETLTDSKVKELFAVKDEPVAPTAKFKVGDIVILTTDYFNDSENNPIWGGAQGCLTGIVENYEPLPSKESILLNMSVRWSNGATNAYNDSHLSLYKAEESTLTVYEQAEVLRFKVGDEVTFEGTTKGGKVVEVLPEDYYGVMFEGEEYLTTVAGVNLKYKK